jgi:hypothetical protein
VDEANSENRRMIEAAALAVDPFSSSSSTQSLKSMELPCSVPVFKCVNGAGEADVGHNGNGEHYESHAAAANVMHVAHILQQEEHVAVNIADGTLNTVLTAIVEEVVEVVF